MAAKNILPSADLQRIASVTLNDYVSVWTYVTVKLSSAQRQEEFKSVYEPVRITNMEMPYTAPNKNKAVTSKHT